MTTEFGIMVYIYRSLLERMWSDDLVAFIARANKDAFVVDVKC